MAHIKPFNATELSKTNYSPKYQSNSKLLKSQLEESYSNSNKGFENKEVLKNVFDIAGKRTSYARRVDQIKEVLSENYTKLTQNEKDYILQGVLDPLSSYVGTNVRNLKNHEKVYESVADIYQNLSESETKQEVQSNTLESRASNSWCNTAKKAAAIALAAGALTIGGYFMTGCGNSEKEIKEAKQEVASQYEQAVFKQDRYLVETKKQVSKLENQVLELNEKLVQAGRPDSEVISETSKAIAEKYDLSVKEQEKMIKNLLDDYEKKFSEYDGKIKIMTEDNAKLVKEVSQLEDYIANSKITASDLGDKPEIISEVQNVKENKVDELKVVNDSLPAIKVDEKSSFMNDSYNYVVGNVSDASNATWNGMKKAYDYTLGENGLGIDVKEGAVVAADYTQKDLGTYVDHVIARNASSDGKEISINPKNAGNHLLNNYKPLADEVTTAKDLGWEGKQIEDRHNKGLDGFKQSGNGLVKIVTAGFVDYNSDEVKKKEGNQLLRTLKSVYDVPFGAVKGIISYLDVPFGGAVGKTRNVAVNTIEGTLNSGVDLTQYTLAIPAFGAQKLENFTGNEGKVSQVTYDALSTALRFGGNVVLHETPQNGKTIRIVDKQVNHTEVSKGEIGATIEMLTCLGLDTLFFMDSVSGASGNGNRTLGGGGGNDGGYNGPGGGGGPVD